MTIFIILAICLITILAAWRDFKTYRLRLRTGLIILSGLMLLGFVIQPELFPFNESANYALITDGSDLNSFSPADYDSVYSIQSRKKFSSLIPSENIRWLSTVSVLGRYLPTGSSVEIRGFGTNEPLPKSYRWIDKLASPKSGLIMMDAPHEIEIGKTFPIKMRTEPAFAGDSLVIIRDGVIFTTAYADSSGELEIRDQLYSEGPVHYQFEWIREDSVITENWNIRVVQTERLSIGMLLYSPLFEMNYLTESLGERGHQIAARTRIGQDRFRYDDLNSPLPASENILSNPAAFDLLVLDVREYVQLQAEEKNRITNALESGLDILLTPPDTENPEEWKRVFLEITGHNISFETLNRLEERLWIPAFVDPGLSEINRIPLMNLNFDSLPDEFTPLLLFQNREPVSVRLHVENGSVSTHLFYQSYNWLLGGQPEIYHRFWADYLGEIITLEQSFLNVATHIPRIDQPMILTFTSKQAPLTIRSLADGTTTTLPVINRQDHPNVGTTTFWPKNPGWHIAEQGENRSWFYVYESDWKFDGDYQTFRDTQRHIENQNGSGDFPGSSDRRKIPDWIWLTGFLGLQGLLWVERKVN